MHIFMGAFVIEGTDFTAHSAIFGYIVKVSALYHVPIFTVSPSSLPPESYLCGGGNLNGMYSLFRLKAHEKDDRESQR